MKVKFMVTGLATIALFSTIMIEHSRISHLTHLSGMISGYIYLKKDFLVTIINNYFNSKKESTKIFHIKTKMDEEVILKKTVNEVLDKLNVEGWENLSDSEQQILYRASEIYSNRDQPN